MCLLVTNILRALIKLCKWQNKLFTNNSNSCSSTYIYKEVNGCYLKYTVNIHLSHSSNRYFLTIWFLFSICNLILTIIPSPMKLWGVLFSSHLSIPVVHQSVHPKISSACTALKMIKLMQKGLCNIFLAQLGPFDSCFTFQRLWVTSFLVKLNITGFGKCFTKLEISWTYMSMEVRI